MTGRTSIWHGAFDRWADAIHAATVESTEDQQAFDSERWLERQSYMLAQAKAGIFPRFTNLPMLVGVTGAQSVVDLGGGSGWTFPLLSSTNTNMPKDYIVIEQQATVDAFSPSFRGDDRMKFLASETISGERMQDSDILYSNSALQYFPDNEFLFTSVSMWNPHWILLDDVQTSVGIDFFSLQHYYGTEIPCRFLNVQNAIEEIRNRGYALRANWEYPAVISSAMGKSLAGNSDVERQIGIPRSLIFEVT